MDLSPTKNSHQTSSSLSQSINPRLQTSNLGVLSIPATTLPSPRDHKFTGETRVSGDVSKPRSPTGLTERVELPSIRQAVPEIQLRTSQGRVPDQQLESDSYSPTAGPRAASTSPGNIGSPSRSSKRRRLSEDDDEDTESRNLGSRRMYQSPIQSRIAAVIPSPISSSRRASNFSSTDSWANSARKSPYISTQRHPSIRSPQTSFTPTQVSPTSSSQIDSYPVLPQTNPRSEWRPTLPSLPSLTFDRGLTQAPRGRNSWSEYALEARAGAQSVPQFSTSFEPPTHSYHPAAFNYGYQQPRGHSYSGPSPLGLDRSPFSTGHPYPGYPGGSNHHGIDVHNGVDGKQRKRRGNLPKETTDKLRAWFIAHLQHPYPSEDEKQELMRRTGLQMNQIANWFINARRRQLPAMINNARAEADARSARVGERGEGTGDYGDEKEKKPTLPPLGDRDGEGGDDDYKELVLRHPSRMMKRESI